MTEPISVAVIGLGVGRGHIEGYLADGRCRVAAICDTRRDLMETVAGELGVGDDCRLCGDYRELLSLRDIRAVSVCTPDRSHCEIGLEFLFAGKDVLMEKPMTVNLDEARRLVTAVSTFDRILMVNNILRFSPRFRRVADLAREGFFGEIFYAEGDYTHNIGDLLDGKWRGARETDYSIVHGGGVHMIDLLRWVVGSEVVEVMSYGNRRSFPEDTFANEDCVVSILRFESGAVAKSLTSIGCVRPIHHNLMVYGTRGTFLNESTSGSLATGLEEADVRQVEEPYPGIKKGVAIGHFIDCVIERRLPLVDAFEGARTIAVCDAALRSLRTGKPAIVETV